MRFRPGRTCCCTYCNGCLPDIWYVTLVYIAGSGGPCECIASPSQTFQLNYVGAALPQIEGSWEYHQDDCAGDGEGLFISVECRGPSHPEAPNNLMLTLYRYTGTYPVITPRSSTIISVSLNSSILSCGPFHIQTSTTFPANIQISASIWTCSPGVVVSLYADIVA